MEGRRIWQESPRGDLERHLRSVETLLGAKRTELLTRLERLPFGHELTLVLISGERVSGRLRGCNGIKVVFTDGRTVRVRAIQSLSTHEHDAEANQSA
jgi:hypothetical protein